MMATVPHFTSGSGLRKFQADGFLFDRVYFCDKTLGNHMDMFLGLGINFCLHFEDRRNE